MKFRQLTGLVIMAAMLGGCASMANTPSALERASANTDKDYVAAVERQSKRGVQFVDVFWVNPPQRNKD